jgi:hypothetical protein
MRQAMAYDNKYYSQDYASKMRFLTIEPASMFVSFVPVSAPWRRRVRNRAVARAKASSELAGLGSAASSRVNRR